MHIAVVAAGAVGGYFGGRLAEAGEDVAFVARGAHLEAIRRGGLRVESTMGDFTVDPARATDDATEIGPVDCVLVAVKTWQLESALPVIQPLVGRDTFVVPLLNGVDAPRILSTRLGREQVLGGLCRILARIAGPGRIRHTGFDPTVDFGELDGSRTERVERLAAAFARARGLTARIPDDVKVALWEKFLFITAMGGVGGVTRAPAGVIRSVPETRALFETALSEVAGVARASGVALRDHAVSRAMDALDRLPPHAMSSLQQDIADGRRSELDAWSGAVVRLGREVGVATPVHEQLHAALLPQELRARGDVEFTQAP